MLVHRLEPELAAMIGGGGRLVISDDPDARDRDWHRLFADFLEILARKGLNKLAIIGEPHIDEERAFAQIKRRAFFVGRATSLITTGLPPGPELVLVGRGVPLNRANLKPRAQGDERIFILPPGLASPDKPDLPIDNIFDGPQLSLAQVDRRLTA